MQHVFFKTQPILKELPLSSLHTAPVFEEEEQRTLVDLSTATSSELRRTLRLEPVSPASSKVSSNGANGTKYSRKYCSNILDQNNNILRALQEPHRARKLDRF